MQRRLFLVGLALLPPTLALAAPKAELWPRWTAHDPRSTLSVDHGLWDGFLGRYVRVSPDGINRVGYAGVRAADRQALDAYLGTLQQTPVSRLARTPQRAFWINLYNALTVQVILDHYPVRGIRDIDISGFFADGPWGKKLVTVEGEALSLDDIEHRILRPLWQDPRTHYAVNCASLGCPNLQARAYTPENLEGLLEKGARDYINHPRGVQVRDGRLIVSSLYAWFQADFGGDETGVIEHLRQYAAPELRRRLETVSHIDDDAYDWSLNDYR